MIHKKVRFKDETYWLHEVVSGMGFNLSPLDHYNDSGELLVNPFTSLSFAVIVRGSNVIERYGEVIGKFEDLVDA
jgi:hypothetical protein